MFVVYDLYALGKPGNYAEYRFPAIVGLIERADCARVEIWGGQSADRMDDTIAWLAEAGVPVAGATSFDDAPAVTVPLMMRPEGWAHTNASLFRQWLVAYEQDGRGIPDAFVTNQREVRRMLAAAGIRAERW